MYYVRAYYTIAESIYARFTDIFTRIFTRIFVYHGANNIRGFIASVDFLRAGIYSWH